MTLAAGGKAHLAIVSLEVKADKCAARQWMELNDSAQPAPGAAAEAPGRRQSINSVTTPSANALPSYRRTNGLSPTNGDLRGAGYGPEPVGFRIR
jgi:hypothetical protein